jgi:threonine dehydrogenase-like Zn-dependent dehydrogenase
MISQSAVEPRKTKAVLSQSAVLVQPRRIEMQKTPLPQPAAGQLRVRLEGSGVCASSLPVWEGRPWFSYPLEPGAPGHEGWGHIDAIGENVTGLDVGDRVALLSYHAYGEYDIADASAVVRLPSALDGVPFPAEPLACAMNVLRRAEIHAGETVAIVGVGFLGALLVQLAARRGARVIAISRRNFALDLAEQMGAEETIRLGENWDVTERVMHLTDGAGCECVIECVGTQNPLDLATELTRERGRLVIAGYHQDGLRQVNMQLWNWRGLDVVNAHERDPKVYVQGIHEAVDAVTDGVLNPLPLLTHSFTLDQLSDAFELMTTRPDGFLKALVRT